VTTGSRAWSTALHVQIADAVFVDCLLATDERARDRLQQYRADLEQLEAAGRETRQSVGQEALIDRR
jgi:hypothetical protein